MKDPKRLSDHLIIGKRAELAACQYLQRNGLVLVQRNFLCSLGEIDLIMRDNQSWVFVEVRYRKSNLYGSAVESVNWSKQQKIIRASNVYLKKQRKNIDETYMRFDIVGVSSTKTAEFECCWIKNAFN